MTRPARLDFQQMRDVARGHGNKERRRMEGHDVIEFQLDVQTKRKQQGKVVDAQKHADHAFDRKVLFLVKIQKVTKTGHPHVGRDKDANLVVHVKDAIVMILKDMQQEETSVSISKDTVDSCSVGDPPFVVIVSLSVQSFYFTELDFHHVTRTMIKAHCIHPFHSSVCDLESN
jgi:hypothetical protein